MSNYGLQFKIKTKYINFLNSRNQTNNVVFNDYIISVAVATSVLAYFRCLDMKMDMSINKATQSTR